VGDMDENGLPDLVAANRDNQANMLMLQTEKRQLRNLSVGSKQNSRSVALGDFDGDQRLDAAYANIGSANSILFADQLRSASANSLDSVLFGEPSNQSYAIASADMDLDGDLDLVVANVMSENVVYLNTGGGRSFEAVLFGTKDEATYGLCLADLNGDQFPDIAVANSGGLNRVYLNLPSRTSAPRRQNANDPIQPTTTTAVTEIAAKRTSDAQQARNLNTNPANPTSTFPLSSSDWPAFRGQGATGLSSSTALPASWDATDSTEPDAEHDGHVRWRVDVPGLGHSSPIVVGDQLFVATAVAESGSAPLQVGRSGKPTAADDDGIQTWEIISFDKMSGKQLWKRIAHRGKPRATRHAKATHANSTLACDGRHLVAFFGSEGLYCYSLDGTLLWKRDLGIVNISKYGIGWGYASSPTIADGRILLVCDDPNNPYLVAIDVHSGKELWRVDRSDDTERNWSTPFVYASEENGKLVVVNGWPAVVAYRLRDGAEVWRIRGGGDNPVPTPFIAENHLFITSAHGAESPIHAVKLDANGDLTEKTKTSPNDAFLWSQSRGGCYMSTPIVYQSNLYLGNSNGVIRCFNAANGEPRFEARLAANAGVIGSLVAGNGKIFCPTESGDVYVLEAANEFRVLGRNSMGNPLFATPAISDDVLYFRTTKEIIAIEAKPAS
ncbi:MAG: PQQ-binding-like beta-propeller repeat protein, partial [Planctomycetota bacterium]